MTTTHRIGQLQDSIPPIRRDKARRAWVHDHMPEMRGLVADGMKPHIVAQLLGLDEKVLARKLTQNDVQPEAETTDPDPAPEEEASPFDDGEGEV